jgi:N-acetylglucosaminyldiphosphoundecaprenol N-acetyl-beta-D-mannosaminyltransferase
MIGEFPSTRLSSAPATTPDAVAILGVRVDAIDVQQVHERIERIIDAGDRAHILNVNINCLNLAWDRPWLRQMLNDAPVVFCDGTGVQWAARLLGGPTPPRIPYNTWMWQFADFAADRGYTFYFLGAKPGVAQRAAERLQEHTPAVRIAGMHDGYFDRTPGSAENQAVLDDINASGANILLMGLGMPMQEAWLLENWSALQANIALTGGAAMDYIAGDLTTPPSWVARYGLEWLQRLIMEPRRLWRRYLIGNPLFFSRVIRQRLRRL